MYLHTVIYIILHLCVCAILLHFPSPFILPPRRILHLFLTCLKLFMPHPHPHSQLMALLPISQRSKHPQRTLTIPIILTSVLQLLFNAADLVIVGRFCGSVSVAAVGATGAITNLIVNLFICLSAQTVFRFFRQIYCIPLVYVL